jgi:site-specific recombinase XerC
VIAARFPEHLAEFIVSVHTDMRLSEQYSCTWSQVDLERRTIELTKTKNGSARTVHLNADALRAIESLKRPGQKASDPVFPREGSQGRFDTRSWFQPCLEEAKITNYVWHSNRHTFCSWLAMAGASIKEIQELAGHKTITMSARYSHFSTDSPSKRMPSFPSTLQMARIVSSTSRMADDPHPRRSKSFVGRRVSPVQSVNSVAPLIANLSR